MEPSPNESPHYVLRGSMRRGCVNYLIVFFLLVAIGLAFAALGTIIRDTSPTALIVASVLALSFLAVIVRAYLASRAAFEIYSDRVVFDSLPEGDGGRRFEVHYDDLKSVMCKGVKITLRPKRGEALEFFGGRLHTEDGFDRLATILQDDYPECVVLRRD